MQKQCTRNNCGTLVVLPILFHYVENCQTYEECAIRTKKFDSSFSTIFLGNIFDLLPQNLFTFASPCLHLPSHIFHSCLSFQTLSTLHSFIHTVPFEFFYLIKVFFFQYKGSTVNHN